MKPMLNSVFSIFRYDAYENQSVIERQRRISFVYACTAMLFCDIGIWILGIDSFRMPIYKAVHPLHFLFTSVLLVSHLYDKLRVDRALILFCMLNQTVLIFEMWLCAFVGPVSENMLMAGLMVMAGLNLSLALMTYIRVLPLVLGGLTIAGYGICCIVITDRALVGMLPVFAACFVVMAIGGQLLSSNIHKLEQEKAILQDDEQKVLNLFDFDKSELMAYISLAREKGLSAEQTGTLLDLIGSKARENIFDNVARYYRQQGIEYTSLQALLPGLSLSEIEICELILKEKKLKEIVRILGKSEGNVTSQRAHIRRKLGLSPSDDLRDELVRLTRDQEHK